MSRVKVYRTGISRRTGLTGIDLQSGKKSPHVIIQPTDVILVEDVKRLLAEEPGASVTRLLELTK